MAQADAPVQPLPPWMATTWLEIGPSSSTFVTIQYPQTYSGPSLPGLAWPWVYRPTDASEGTAVSIIGGPAGLVTVGGSFATSVVPTATTSPTFISDAPVPSISPTAEETSPLQISSPVPSTSFTATSSTLTLSEPSQTIASSDSTSSNSPSSSPSASTSAGLIPSDPSQFSNSSDTSLSAGAIAGIVFGSLALIILLLLLLVFCSRRRRKRRNESDFTIVDPEGYPGDSAVRRTPSGSYQSIRTSRVPIAVQRTRASSPRRFMSEQSRRPEIIAANPDESSALMSYHHREGVITDNESRLDAPPIMLQSPDSAESIRHCPSNNSLGTTVNTDSTKTRASLISQFPVYDRKPSDHSSQDHEHGHGGAGGAAPGPSGTNPPEPKQGHNSGSGKSGSDTGMFSSPPPRPPSRTRTVPNPTHATSIGLGRPMGPPRGPRSPRLFSLPEASLLSTSTSTPLQRSVSNRSSRSLLGAPVWLKGFTWLKPFFEPGYEGPEAQGESTEGISDAEEAVTRPLTEVLLPTAAPMMRQVPEYRRVTTTAAAYDVQDLRDLAQRRTGAQSEELEIGSPSDDSASDGEGSSFLESSQVITPPTTDLGGRRASTWSRATLGQPLQRISGISSLSLSDIPSISASMTSSARARAKSRSRSDSQSVSSHISKASAHGHKVSNNSLGRAASRSTLASRTSSHPSRSRSGSGSEPSQAGSKVSSRRNNNSSGGSNASSGHGSHRSTKSGRTALRRVLEDGEAVPPLPPKPAVNA